MRFAISCGEHFVDLPYAYLFSPQPIPGKQSRNGARGGPQHSIGANINRHHLPVDQLDHGSDTEPPQTFFVSNPDRCRAGEEFPARARLLRSNTAGSLACLSSEVSPLGHLTGDGRMASHRGTPRHYESAAEGKARPWRR